jgi:hypothetical protein
MTAGRTAKRCATDIQYSRSKDDRRRLYRKLIAATDATRAALHRAAGRLTDLAGIAPARWRAKLQNYLPLIARVLDQSERRVLHGQACTRGVITPVWNTLARCRRSPSPTQEENARP